MLDYVQVGSVAPDFTATSVYDEEFDRAASEDIDTVSSRFLPPRQVI